MFVVVMMQGQWVGERKEKEKEKKSGEEEYQVRLAMAETLDNSKTLLVGESLR